MLECGPVTGSASLSRSSYSMGSRYIPARMHDVAGQLPECIAPHTVAAGLALQLSFSHAGLLSGDPPVTSLYHF